MSRPSETPHRMRPLDDDAVLDEERFERVRGVRRLVGEHVRQQRDRFHVAAGPAVVGHRDGADSVIPVRVRVAGVLFYGDVHGGRGVTGREGVLPGRGAARDLDVDGAITIDVVLVDQAVHGGAHGVHVPVADLERGQSPLHARDMVVRPVRAALVDADDLVDAVGEEEPAVIDRHAGLVVRDIFAVQVDQHDRSVV